MTAQAGTGRQAAGPTALADVLERVLDRGVVVVGDIVVSVVNIELLTLKVRLLIASVDTAQRIGIDWWRSDPFLNASAGRLSVENEQLKQRVAELEGGRRTESTR